MEYKWDDFEDEFDEGSKERGTEIFENECVTIVSRFNGFYVFQVSGTHDDYLTDLTLDKNNNIKRTFCTCPYYSSGHLCKHLYASYLELKDTLELEGEYEPTDEELRIIEADLDKLDDSLKDEVNDSNIKKTKLTKKDKTKFKDFATTYDIDTKEMTKFLNSFELSSDDLVELFMMIRKPNALQVFISFLDNNIDADFFKKIDLTKFPNSFSLKPLGPFLIKHSDMLACLSQESINQLFLKKRIPELNIRITLLFLSLTYGLKFSIKGFFEEPENRFTFFQDVFLIDYMKTKMTKEECLECFQNKINKVTLTRLETAFIYPYFSDGDKEYYKNFFKVNNYTLEDGYNGYYYSSSDFDNEYNYKLTVNRDFYNLVVNRPKKDMTVYNLRTMFYLRESLFASDDKDIYAKRFRQLALAMFRSQKPDYMKLYCCIRIIYEYADKIPLLKDLPAKASENDFSNLYICPAISDLYYKLSIKYSLDFSISSKEYK